MTEHLFDSLINRQLIHIIVTQKLDLIWHISFAFFQIVLRCLLNFSFILREHIVQIVSYHLVDDPHIHT